MEELKKEKRKHIITTVLLIIGAIILAGTAYATYNWIYEGVTENTLTTPEAELEFLESNNEIINITDAIPMTDETGKTQGEKFDFQVRTKAPYDTSISYDLVLEKLEVDSGKTALKNNEVKVYIEDFQGNVILEPTKLSELNNYKLVSKTNNHSSTNQEIINKYRLRVWLDKDVDIFDNQNKQIKFRININKYPETTDKNQIVLTYDNNGGEGCTKTTVTYNEAYGSLCTPTRENYAFLGWYTEKDGGTKVTSTTKATYDYIYAHWRLNAARINVLVNNGKVDGESSKTVQLNTNATFNINTNAGYNTPVVTCTNDQTGTISNNTLTVSNVTKDTTCTVTHSVNTYQVRYNANGGSGSMSNSTFTYDVESNLSENTFTKEGYTFKGWSTSETGGTVNYQNGVTIKNLTSENNKIVDLYAVWKAESYNVNVVVQNGTVDTATKSIEHGQNGIFNLTPEVSGTTATVTCTNNQTGSITNNVLTVSNVTNNTTCTVKYITEMTTLYTDGTLIINENLANRSSNITNHGAVTNEYDALSSSNSYVMSDYSAQPWANERDNITSIEIDNEIHPTSTANWFHSLRNVSYGDFTNLKTESVTNMRGMFSSLGHNSSSTTFELIGLDNWDTSIVTSMSSMFGNRYLNSIYNEYGVGYNATTWTIGDLSGWDTSSVTDMSKMFDYAGYSATTFNIGDLSSWDTSSVTNMSGMFNGAGRSATTWSIGDLSSWNTSSATDMDSMFYQAGYSATTWTIGDLSSWNTSSVTYMNSMFYQAGYSTTTWTIGELSSWNTSSVRYMNSMFDQAGYSATTWSIGDLSGWNTSSVTDMSYMFSSAGYSATTFNIGNLSNWNTSSVTKMRNMFYSAGYSAATWSIGDLSGWNTSSVTYMQMMFEEAGHDATTFELDLSRWDTSSVTRMDNMFTSAGYSATTWSIGDLSSWDVSSVTTMNSMFYYAGRSATIFDIGNLSSWNTSSVTDMVWMFRYAGNSATTWTIGDLSGWNTSSVTSMSYMFEEAGYSATTFELDLSKWDTSSVTSMNSMFTSAGYSATTWSIGDLSGWDISSVTSMSSMFYKASYSATDSVLIISNWNPTSVTNMSWMFYGAGFKTIYCNNDWSSLSNITNSGLMFSSATKLVGGNGTTYNSSYVNKTYARPDTSSTPGYFTTATYKTVNVVVQNATVDNASKSVVTGTNARFKLTPTTDYEVANVSCTNGQTASVTNNVLSIANVSDNTTCTVTYSEMQTVLYTDGTLIINELPINRSSNISEHGAVTNEYDALSSSNSYVFSSNTSMPWNSEKTSVTSMEIGNNIEPVSTAYWASGLKNMTTGDFTKLDTSSVTNMRQMFSSAGRNATTWSIGDLSSWNTSSVTNMSRMFEEAGYSATTFELDLSRWDTSSVTNMSDMFDRAGRNATTWSIGDLSGWNTSSVTDMSSMFYYAGEKATTFELNLSSWNTSSVTDMSWMFDGAGYSATTFELDLSRWDTSSVTDMSYMFSNAGYNATTWSIGDLSSWDVSSVTTMNSMFNWAGYNATAWSIGDLSRWDTSSVTDMSSMFSHAGASATWSLNCSGWNVNKVTSYTDFNRNVESKVTAPTWVN